MEVLPQARHQQAGQVTILLHKPVGYVSGLPEDGHETAAVLVTGPNHWRDDRSGRRFEPAHSRNLAPAGRLDIDSTGLLVLTQDGRVAKLLIGDDLRHEVAEGDGPVNALDAALRRALNGRFPSLASVHLVDYKVRVINSEAATAAKVRVMIESRDDHDSWGTVGVHENVIEASWMALVDSIEYKLCKDEKQA